VIAYPAIDLRGGQVVQLVGGDPADQRVQLPDPAAVARRWIDDGFAALHVVDLDAALGHGTNHDAIHAILATVDVPVQVGGGIRDDEAIAALLAAGARRVIVGTRAVLEPDWLRRQAEAWPDRILLAADCRGDDVVVQGWTERAGASVPALLELTAALPLAGILVTDVSREGRMEGADTARFAALARMTPHPLLASGGVTTAGELRELASGGLAGAVLGMALYTGALDARATAREFRN
jgi:phosphoribosylformimino-5-aminoimidazole carboxamide ribotide isomerase